MTQGSGTNAQARMPIGLAPAKKKPKRFGFFGEEVPTATRSHKGYWRMSANSLVQRALTNRWLHEPRSLVQVFLSQALC